jgi:hypothetical protein
MNPVEKLVTVGEDIDAEFRALSSDVYYVGALWADAQRNAAQAKVALDVALATSRRMVTEVLQAEGSKTTERAIDAEVDLDPDVHRARLYLLDMEHEEAKVRALVDALRAKKDMLVSLGAHIRAEMQGDITIRNPQHNR